MSGMVAELGSLQDGPTARPTFRIIQVLRAIAALMVVAHHATIMLHDRNGLAVGNWLNGGAGVDIFFVISGFVMTISSAPLRKTAHPARTFLARRLERIVPLYWIATTAKVVMLLLAPALALNALGSTWHVIASYLFIPSVADPIIVVGWTLNFEMVFYLLFAIVLATRTSLKVLFPAFLLLSVIAWIPKVHINPALGMLTRSIIFEFLYGIALALILPRIRRIPPALAALLLLGGFAILFFGSGRPIVSYWRGFSWGLPALAIVCGALALESRIGTKTPRFALELGDASYSVYLVHGFVLPLIGVLLARLGTHWTGAVPISLFLMILLSAIGGEVVYRGLERPIMDFFKGRRRTAIPANA